MARGRDRASGSPSRPSTDADDPRLAALAARLERVESTLALRDLKARYAALVDRRHRSGAVVEPSRLDEAASAAAALFTEDGVWDGGPTLGRVVGRRAIARRLADTTLVFARHFFVSPRLEIDPADPDRAKGRWELLSPCRDTEGRDFWMTAIEDDEYARVDGVWLHRSMRLETVLVAPADGVWKILG